METYRELYFRGSENELKKFVQEIPKYAKGDWKAVEQTERWKEYLAFDYLGKELDKAEVSIYLGEKLSSGTIHVGNIVPLEKNQLTIKEYNKILMKFYEDIIQPYEEEGSVVEITKPTDDVFDPTSVISQEALDKLRIFCSAANKSTGSSHPCDQERWFDFICQTVDDDRMFDSSTLATFLQDEDYWGKKKAGYIGVMGNYAWDEENAYELASEYENACEILLYYKKSRGL